MAESTNAFIRGAGRLGALGTDTVANLAAGAQLGIGSRLKDLDAATPLVLSPAVCIVLNTPGIFRLVPGMDQMCKVLMERHATEITGIDIEYTLEKHDTQAGHDGQQYSIPTNAKRNPVNPSFTYPEVTGNLVWRFYYTWIALIKQADTQGSTLSAVASQELSPVVMSSIAADLMFIQFDTTFQPQNIIDASIITGVWPEGTGPMGMKRTIGSSESPARTIQHTGVLQHNANTKRVAMDIAEILQIHRADYDISVPVSQQIHSRLTDMGIQREIAETVGSFGPAQSA